MRTLIFIVIIAVLGAGLAFVRAINPWLISGTATYVLEGWAAMALIACVIGLIANR